MVMNKNKEYELLTQKIFQNILHHEGVKNIEIKHNVTLKGLKGQHQIDVYWRYELAGVEYQTAIECKNYGSTVEIKDIRAFESTLSDIQSINGIFVAKTGYQSGAIEYAKNSKIKILELKEQSDGDWITNEKDENGNFIPLMRQLNIISHIISPPMNMKLDFEWDLEWIKENTSLQNGDKFSFYINGETQILDADGKAINDIEYFYKKLKREPLNEEIIAVFEFENSYIVLKDNVKAKFKKLIFTYMITESILEMNFNATDYISHVLKNVETGKWDFVDIHGNVRGESYKK